MDIPMKAVLEGITSMLERSVLPEISTKYARGQTLAAIFLLKDLVVQLETREATLVEELGSLTTALQGILEGLEGTDGLAADPALRELGAKIRSALGPGHRGAQASQEPRPDGDETLERRMQALQALLDSCLSVLAEAERRLLGPSREALASMRQAVRAHLRRQFEIRARSAPPLEIGQLSKAQ
ncbi:MAG: hypothetical protein HYY20_00230 [Candidatus Tectomicrobia bacterium]|uniref:Uncharacterized protein n=1 Tax=Tectimicrobiota bacterium TaxID=2528274 RepID=A0A932FVI3_UNCTE|nr:hypothetical protein [Candidatus Tectomicrobia bacterium]